MGMCCSQSLLPNPPVLGAREREAYFAIPQERASWGQSLQGHLGIAQKGGDGA